MKYRLRDFMEKEAFLPIISTGGGSVVTNQGVGLEAGYDHLFGLVPFPNVGVRFGDEEGGLSITGPIPGIGVDDGIPAGKWRWNGIPSLWQYIKDRSEGRQGVYLDDDYVRITDAEREKMDKLVEEADAVQEGDGNYSKLLKVINKHNRLVNTLKKKYIK